MQITKETRYLCLWVMRGGPSKIISVKNNDTLVADFRVNIHPDPANQLIYVDLGRFDGLDLTFWIETENGPVPYEPVLAAERPDAKDYNTYKRPKVHFTSRYGWLNDPNGLLYADGVYHLFYQHNPAGVGWGNMHWGHAISIDLVHWTEKPAALYPDEHGSIFSGSGIPDPEDHLHIGNGIYTPLIFYYTAAGGYALMSNNKPFTQHMAYSSDGGIHFTKYGQVLPELIKDNRDPKVLWADELSAYIMALFYEGNTYVLFTSADLVHWTEWQKIELTGTSECPDIYPLVCDDTGERLWIISGAADMYNVGKLTPDGFVPVQECVTLRHGADFCSYAAQSFTGIDDRVVRIAWGNLYDIGTIFTGQMHFPTEMRLTKVNGMYRLSALPVKEIDLLRKETITAEKTISNTKPLCAALTGDAYDVSLCWAENAADMQLTLYGKEIRILPSENKLITGEHTIPLAYGNARNLRMIVDTLCIEIYADDGRVYSAFLSQPDFENKQLELKTLAIDQTADVTLTLSPLEWIW